MTLSYVRLAPNGLTEAIGLVDFLGSRFADDAVRADGCVATGRDSCGDATWSWEPKLRILLNDEDGVFSQFSFYDDSLTHVSAIAPVDLNRDGRVDLAVEDSGLGAVRILSNHGAASFRDWAWQDFPTNHYGNLHAADLNNDGWPDLLHGTGSQLQVWDRFNGPQ